MTARDMLRILREGWILVLVTTLVFAGAGLAYSATSAPEYRATSSVSISACIALQGIEECDPLEGMTYAKERAAFYAGLGTEPAVFEMAAAGAGLSDDVSASDLAGATSVSQLAGSAMLTIAVTWSDPEVSAVLADAVADAFVAHAQDVALDVDPAVTNITFAVPSEASAAGSTVGGDRRTLVLVTLLGVLLGLSLAVAKWALDKRIRDTQDAESLTNLDVLSSLSLAPSRAMPEGFHELRSILSSRISASPAAVVAVVAPQNGDTASAVATHLAEALSVARSRVAIVHANGTRETASLSGVLDGTQLPDQAIAAQASETPMVFAYSDADDTNGAALSTPQFLSFLTALREVTDMVLIATAPGSKTAAMTSVAQHADAAVVLFEPRHTTRPQLSATLRALELIGVPPVGLAAVTLTE